MNTIDRMIKDLESDKTVINGCTTAGEIAITLKSLEKRRVGKWLLDKNEIPYCSQCKNPQYGGHYCANCGAYMQEGMIW